MVYFQPGAATEGQPEGSYVFAAGVHSCFRESEETEEIGHRRHTRRGVSLLGDIIRRGPASSQYFLFRLVLFFALVFFVCSI